MGVLVVRDSRQALHLRARRPELRLEDQPVGLVDLAWPERLARPAKLRSRGQHGGPRDRAADHFGDTRGSHGTELRSTEQRPGRDDLVPHPTAATPGAPRAPRGAPRGSARAGPPPPRARGPPPGGRTFAPWEPASRISTVFSLSTTSSTAMTASAPSGTTPPVEISIA